MKVTIKSFAKIVSSLALSTLVVASCASAGVIFQDDFNDGNKNGWTDHALSPWYSDPTSTVTNGEIAWGSNNLGATTVSSLGNIKDARVDVDATVNGTGGEGIIFRYNGAGTWVAGFYNPGSQQIYFLESVLGDYGFYAREYFVDLQGTVHLTGIVQDLNITLTASDSFGHSFSTSHTLLAGSMQPGEFGLFGDGGDQFDNFMISEVPEPGSLLALVGGLVCMAGMIRRRH